MELFYYCISAPKEDERRTRNYIPAELLIDYNEHPPAVPEFEEEEEEEGKGVVPTYSDLNDSLHEVEIAEKEYLDEPDGHLSPVEEYMEEPHDVTEPELDANLLKRHNSRKFKTPSFKWKKKTKKKEPGLFDMPAPAPSAPELSVSESPVNQTADDNIEPELDETKISLDGLNEKLEEKETEITIAAEQKDADVDRLQNDAVFYQERLREAEELLARYKTDNVMLHQRVELAERDRSALQHGTAADIERVRAEYQTKLNELSQYPEKLSSAEARFVHAEAETEVLRSQLTDKNRTVEDLNKKIDTFQGQIAKLKDKFHAVNEDNIELSNKSQSHERKIIEADMHNKNLMDLVSKKDDTIEQHQPSLDVDAQLANLPPPPASPSTDNNVSEEEKAAEDSETETGSSSEEEEDVDWSEMLKNAEMNRERLGLDEMSDGESSVDEDGNRVPKKKEQNGLTSADIMNRMATNQFLGYDEFGRPMNGKYNGSMMSGMKGQKNRNMLFGMEGGKRSKTTGANNRGAGKKEGGRRSGGGRRNKKAGGNMLLGF